MNDDVIKRLESLGYTYDESTDSFLLGFIIQKGTNHIFSACNITAVPDGLYQVAVDMAAGEFLLNMKAAGRLTPENGFDLSAAVKQIKEGDTTVTYAFGEGSLTHDQQLDSLIKYLMTYGLPQFVTYRKLVW